MLIRFTLENWMSFRDQVTFSLIASRERQHAGRLPSLKKYGAKILPVAAIYGGNAAGKTNLFKALNFAKWLVIVGTQPETLIPVDPYRLDKRGPQRSTGFAFELLIDDVIYEFSFAVSRDRIEQEKLVLVTSASEKTLYHRHDGKMDFDSSLAKDDFLNFAFKGTRDNQLFLTNTISQKIDRFRPVYGWFKDRLELVAPDSRFAFFEQYFDERHRLYSTMNELLPQLDTGISHLGAEEIPFDRLRIHEMVKRRLQEEVKEGMTIRLLSDHLHERYVVTRRDGELHAKKLVAYHAQPGGTQVQFELDQESDGSQRVIDLLPAFLDVSEAASSKVYVIDELDRSLHTLLTRRLLEGYLAACSPRSRAQLLFTTHDVLLMDQDLLRRDEMWVAERDASGASTLLSFSEYRDIRYDKDVRKSYLQGRLGGIPRILLGAGFAPRQDSRGGTSRAAEDQG